MTTDECTVFELRQYTLHRGRRDELIDLFDREFVESQEAVGMRIVGQFRDLDRPDHFVWVRGFRDMESRAEALEAFYGGPVWKANRDKANATMIDSDDVLLLRPPFDGAGFAAPDQPRPGRHEEPSPTRITAAVHRIDPAAEDASVEAAVDRLRPELQARGLRPLALLTTEPAENTFPALPVRTGEHVLAWFAQGEVDAEAIASEALSSPIQTLRLETTARSRLR
ncbi:NIPSNAP family protein [Glycomyces dulcitolivorans]|uniref:NIPSNAP family protein n=1 Tax=Glycomyces dulcitolivorans TaxID=2200759 RepID=UPI000DD41FFB|nr:NIPSNAP family protein [Glycomyces dulcitolivorans]